ncbi:MAG TPA: hypothetical protein VFG04_28575 [Planctomycetaceae bacterium]|jgi:hypothetical protein|nr:hypothetical protein [Planctomycetaceae bacterium]
MHYAPLNLPFSTADAEAPQITLANDRARISYRDWQEKLVELLFHDVVAISWDVGDAALSADHRDDRAYIVHDSPWLARHREAGTIMPNEVRQHFLLAFNAVGVLQVLASSLEIVAAPATGPL